MASINRRMMQSVVVFTGAMLLTVSMATAADTLRVGKPIPDGFDFAILDVGMAKGFYRDQNLDIQEFVLAGGAKLHQAMTANSLDIALGAGPDLGFLVKGAPEKGVAAMAGDPLNMAMLVAVNSKIRTVADLKNKKVSVSTVGSLTAWLAQQVALREGWGANGVQLVGTGGGAAATIATLTTGQVDAASASLEMGLRVEAAGQGKILLSFGNFVHPFLTHIIYATDDLMQRNPDAIRRFLKAWFRTVAYMQQHKDESVTLVAPVMQVSPAIASKVYDAEMPMYFTDGHFDPKAVDVVKQSLIDMGVTDKKPDDKDLYMEKFLDPS